MSFWNGKAFLRFLYKGFFKNRGTNYRLTAKRLGVLLLAVVIYLPAELLIWLGWGLDEILFPDYREIKIPQPVFIIGNPRSGTTFLHRTLARDTANFHTLHTWEIFGSPSITGRKIAHFFVKVGRAVGIQVGQRIRKLEKIWKENDPIHRLKLREPEEDEYLFIHIFSTMKIWSLAAMEDECDPYIYFDKMLPNSAKQRMMDFYESCLRRLYYYQRGRKKRYLSKNPHFSPAIETLLDRFPDAKFIYLIRNPIEAVASHISLKDREWQLLGSPLEKYNAKDFIIRSSHWWYEYPLMKLDGMRADRAVIVNFDDLVTDARKTITDIYQQLGIQLTAEFEDQLRIESHQARNHQSEHSYSLRDMNLDPQVLREEFSDLYEKYNFKDISP